MHDKSSSCQTHKINIVSHPSRLNCHLPQRTALGLNRVSNRDRSISHNLPSFTVHQVIYGRRFYVQLCSCKFLLLFFVSTPQIIIIFLSARIKTNKNSQRWQRLDIANFWLPTISDHRLGLYQECHESLNSRPSTSQWICVRVQRQLRLQWAWLCWLQRTWRQHEGNQRHRKTAT